MRFRIALSPEPQEYKIGNVSYIVESAFQTVKIPENPTIAERFCRIITSDFVDLTDKALPDKMAAEYVCSTAGEEA